VDGSGRRIEVQDKDVVIYQNVDLQKTVHQLKKNSVTGVQEAAEGDTGMIFTDPAFLLAQRNFVCSEWAR